MNRLERAISEFLFFGFIPNRAVAEQEVSRLSQLAQASSGIPSVEEMKLTLVEIVESLVAGNSEIVIPVSSGLDSRGLLGAALECREARNIHAYTFGHPGTADWELTPRLVRKHVPQHFRINVNPKKKLRQSWDYERLANRVSRRPDGLVLAVGESGSGLDSPRLRALGGLPRLNGFLGDSVSGKKLNSPPDSSWEGAIDFFIKKNRPYKGLVQVTHPDFNPRESFPASPLLSDFGLATLNDQLDWGYRQQQRVAFFVGFGSGNSLHPYADNRWRSLFLRVPAYERQEQRLYRKFLMRSFPLIFKDLTPELAGRHRARMFGRNPFRPSMTSQHVDMDLLLEKNPSFRNFVISRVETLATTGLLQWIDWSEVLGLLRTPPERGGMGRLGYALASLEINPAVGRFDRYMPESQRDSGTKGE